MTAERAGEGFVRLKSHLEGNRQHRLVGDREEVCGTFEAQTRHVAHRRLADDRHEAPMEVKRGIARQPRQAGQSLWLVEVIVHLTKQSDDPPSCWSHTAAHCHPNNCRRSSITWDRSQAKTFDVARWSV